MKKLPSNEFKKNRVYRASDIEENQIKKLHKKSRTPLTLSRWKVQKLLVDKA